MRFDDVTTLNTNLEQQALYFEQLAALKETQAARLRSAARAMRGLASEEVHPDDPTIDARAFILPSVAKPKDALQEYGRGNRELPSLEGQAEGQAA